MRILDLGHYATGICAAAAVLAGCGPLRQAQDDMPPPGEMPQSRATAAHAEHGRSWMLPEAKGEDLIYAADTKAGDVYVVSYPEGKLVGTITGLYSPIGECVDASGNVWITGQSSNSLIEYAHGGTNPIGTLQEGANAEPLNCSVDPTTGNLAVTNRYPTTVAVFHNAMGSPTMYQLDGFKYWSACTYDANGNLFANDWATAQAIAELPRGSYTLTRVRLKQHVFSGSIQWDRTYLALHVVPRGGLGGPTKIARLQVSNSIGRIVGETILDDRKNRQASLVAQFFIAGSTIIGPDRFRGPEGGPHGYSLTFWNYPSGGHPTRVISKIGHIDAAVISFARKRG
jgi:hypothetical protein